MVIDEGLMEKKSLERVKLAMLEKLKLIGKQIWSDKIIDKYVAIYNELNN